MRPNSNSNSPAKRRKRGDPVGRVDILAGKLLEKVVGRSTNPFVQALYQELKPEIEYQLTARLGPRNKRLRQLRELVRSTAPPTTGVHGHTFTTTGGGQ